MNKKSTSPMELKYTNIGQWPQEIKAIEHIQSHFRGHSDMFPWKGYVGYTLVEGDKKGQIDLIIVTHCNVLVIEFKDWNNIPITSRDGKWYKGNEQRERSPVKTNEDKVFDLVNPKLKRRKNKFTNKGYKPFTRSIVVMCGNSDWSQLPATDKVDMMSLNDFIKLAEEENFNKKFQTETRNPKMKVLNQDFHIFDEICDDADSAPINYTVDGFIRKDLIFTAEIRQNQLTGFPDVLRRLKLVPCQHPDLDICPQ